MGKLIRVGGVAALHEGQLSFAQKYLANAGGDWSCPAYDAYPGSGTAQVGPQDLLAIAPLNAGQRLVPSYYVLEGLLDKINERLAQLPDCPLEKADPAAMEAVANLFAILDEEKTPNVGLTKLAKVVHLKRPDLIPLYDRYIRRCYS